MEFREAEQKDVAVICELVAAAIAHMQEQGIDQWDKYYPTAEDFLSDLEENTLLVGTIAGEVAVTVTVNQTCEPEYQNGDWQHREQKYCIVHRLCVHPRHQGKGVAGQTLAYIEAEMRKRGIGAVRLDAFSQNPCAIALYTGRGYERRGVADWRKGRFYLMEKRL
ncbi:MAG: GNAT family N-acetyltransferase [Lachnospiraceae bacterium]|nr:GNAT family N-acetyltransferase [Lachnospiraceae bacterium]